MDEDSGFTTSDAEFDSEVEDTDVDGELGVWLDQLKSYSATVDNVSLPKKPVSSQNLLMYTPKQAMDTFRCSILDTGDGSDLDLDSILGELCQLETQLTTQQSEINTSIENAEMATKSTNVGSPQKTLTSLDPVPKMPEANMNLTNGCRAKNRDSLAELESALDDQLQNALSELSDLVGISFDMSPNTNRTSDNQNNVTSNGNDLPNTTDKLSVRIHDSRNGNSSSHNGASKCGYTDYSPDGAEADSAFSDSGSLPSSGSHVSMTTTSSQNSNGYGSGSSSASSGTASHIAAERMFGILDEPDVKERLAVFRESLHKLDLSPVEQAAQLKAEKVKIALEKIKEANIQKLFVRFYSEDGCSKSILVDEAMRVTHILDRLITKNNVAPSVDWAIVEHLPDLFMERLVEDHELMIEPLFSWSRSSRNKLLFVQSPGKYEIFHNPQMYFGGDKKDEVLSPAAKDALLEEHFSDNNSRFQEVEGHLYLKSEGKKAWKKFYFVLRASGLYYCPKGKGKQSKDLLCLQNLDIVEVYTAVSWKKKYKSPTDFGFALKHPQIQNKAPKYIKYLCAEDQDTFSQWVTGLRIAKYGNQLLKNFRQSEKNLETWESREILPNQNFAEYLIKQNERNEELAKEHHLLPRKSVCAATLLGDGSVENSDSDKQSVSSGSSGSSRSSTCSHERQGSQVSVQSWEDNLGSRKTSDGYLGYSTCRRGSLPSIGEGRRRSSMDYNQNREYKRSDEDVRMPGKMIPNLPVTTQTTRQITDQNAANGTLKRRPSHCMSPSHGTLKANKRNIPSDSRVMSPPGGESRVMSPPGGDTRVMSPPGGESRIMTPPGGETRVMSPPGGETRVMSPTGGETRVMSPPGGESRVMSPPGGETRFMSPPGGETRVMSPPGGESRVMSPPGGETRFMSPPGGETRVMSPPGGETRFIPPPAPHKDNDYDDDDFPLPPPPPELLEATAMEDEGHYSVVPCPIYDVPTPRGGSSLPSSPQKRPPVYAKPPVVRILPPPPHCPLPALPVPACGAPPATRVTSPSWYDTPKGHMVNKVPPVLATPKGHMVHTAPPAPRDQMVHTVPPGHNIGAAPQTSSPLHNGHQRASSSPYQGETLKKAPPLPKRSQTTRLSNRRESPQTQYFISDLQRVLTQKQAFSLQMPLQPSFPPVPPPHQPRNSAVSPLDDEWLPPPPAELLIELQEARRKTGPPPPPKHYMSAQHSVHESYA